MYQCDICLDDMIHVARCYSCKLVICDNCIIKYRRVDSCPSIDVCSQKCNNYQKLFDIEMENDNSEIIRLFNENHPYYQHMDHYIYIDFVDELQILSNFSNHPDQKRKRNNFLLLWLQTYLIKDIAKIVMSY